MRCISGADCGENPRPRGPRAWRGSPRGEVRPRQETRMETLHALRFLSRWLMIDRDLRMDDWSEMYMVQWLYPHQWPCGCPNQLLRPVEPGRGQD